MKPKLVLLVTLPFISCKMLKQVLPVVNPNIMEIEQVKNFLNKSPITTSFADANSERVLSDDFGRNEKFTPLYTMPRTAKGGYVLSPGFYEMTCKSYCLMAGTHAPSSGDGHLFAPLKGKRKDIMQTMLRKAEAHPEIKQQDIQSLLWAMIASAKFKDLSPSLQITALKLLTPLQLINLNGGAISLVPEQVLNNAINSFPPAVQSVIKAENELRKLLYTANASYEELEKVAILAGVAPIVRPDINKGRWSKHSDGYYIRYYPDGYSKTTVHVYVPKEVARANNDVLNKVAETQVIRQIEFDATDDVAVPASTTAQRILQSNEPVEPPKKTVLKSGECPDRTDPNTRNNNPPHIAPSTRLVKWDTGCLDVAGCIAASFEGITSIEGPNERCKDIGKYKTKREAFQQTNGLCNKDTINGKGTRGVSYHSFGKAIDAYVTPLQTKGKWKGSPTPHNEPWEVGSPEYEAGETLKNWVISHRERLNIKQVVWNNIYYDKSNDWKGKSYQGHGPDPHYSHVHISCE